MFDLPDLLKYQIGLLTFATIARLAYYGFRGLLGNVEQVSSWGEIRRVGSDLCLMSFGTVVAATLNPQSLLKANEAAHAGYSFWNMAFFLALYVLSYSFFRETAAPRPLFEKSWQNLKRVAYTVLSMGFGIYAIGRACDLAASISG